MVESVPVLGEDDVLEMLRGAVDGVDDGIAVGNGERAAGAEVVLHVDDQEDVGGSDLHLFSIQNISVIGSHEELETTAVIYGALRHPKNMKSSTGECPGLKGPVTLCA